jgi:hypothetical protein
MLVANSLDGSVFMGLRFFPLRPSLPLQARGLPRFSTCLRLMCSCSCWGRHRYLEVCGSSSNVLRLLAEEPIGSLQHVHKRCQEHLIGSHMVSFNAKPQSQAAAGHAQRVCTSGVQWQRRP